MPEFGRCFHSKHVRQVDGNDENSFPPRKVVDSKGFPQLWINETKVFSARLNIRPEDC